jgi:DNA repair exonuclease SbcCD ATPase subunit
MHWDNNVYGFDFVGYFYVWRKMKIKLKKLVLDKFRGVSGTFEFNENRNVFSGPNGSGKTTLFDAETWLRTGKDSQGKTDFDIKTIENGQEISKAAHSVNAVYEIDGNQAEFGRVYFEKWSKKRGELEATKDGNKTKYFVDGLDVPKTKFNAMVDDYFTTNYPLVSDIHHLINLPWKKRREILSSMAPVDEELILDSIEGFKDLLKGRDVEQAKQMAEQRRKKIEKDLIEINATIKANQDISGSGDIDQAELAIEEAKGDVIAVQAKIDSHKAGGGKVEELKRLNDELFKAQSKFQESYNKALDENRVLIGKIEVCKKETNSLDYEIEVATGDLKRLGEQWQQIKSRKAPVDGMVCEHCGQDLPEEKIQELKATFMHDRAEALAENKLEGEKTAQELKRLKAELEKNQAELEKLQQIEKPAILNLTTNDTINTLKSKIEELKVSSPEIPEDLQNELTNAEHNLDVARDKKADLKAVSDAKEKLDNAKEQKQEIQAEMDRISLFLAKYDEYTKRLSEAVEKPVNDMFALAKFRMFETLENGNQVQCCEVMDKENRPYGTALSNGERIKVGLDIVSTLQEKLGISAPVFIDNAEALTSAINLNCQFIELRANENFKTLTKEV